MISSELFIMYTWTNESSEPSMGGFLRIFLLTSIWWYYSTFNSLSWNINNLPLECKIVWTSKKEVLGLKKNGKLTHKGTFRSVQCRSKLIFSHKLFTHISISTPYSVYLKALYPYGNQRCHTWKFKKKRKKKLYLIAIIRKIEFILHQRLSIVGFKYKCW